MKRTTKAKPEAAAPAAAAATPAATTPKARKPRAASPATTISPKVAAAAAAAAPATPAPAPAPAAPSPTLAPAPAAPAPEAKKTSAAPAQPARPTIIKIKAQIDVGFGNALTIRGSGAGLSWDKGVQMNCVNDDLWSLTLVGVTGKVAFKFLVNDLTWSSGEDYVAQPGDEIILVPAF